MAHSPKSLDLSAEEAALMDDPFKDLDDLRSIDGSRVQMIIEEWDDDDFFGVTTETESVAAQRRSDFDEELERIYRNSAGGGDEAFADEDDADPRIEDEATDEDSVGSPSRPNVMVGQPLDDRRQVARTDVPNLARGRDDEIAKTDEGEHFDEEIEAGYEAEESTNFNEIYLEPSSRFDHNDDEDYDGEEEDDPPPPPPNSPPPEPSDDDGSSSVSRSSKANSLNSLNNDYEMFDDIIYRAGFDRDGLPIVVLLPGDVPSLLKAHGEENIGKMDSRLVDYCINFIGEVATRGPYVLVVAPGGGSKDLFPSKQAFSRLIEIHSILPRMPHKKSLRKLIVLHPDPFASASLFVLKRVLSVKFWKKLVFVKRIADLDATLQPSSEGEQVSLPLPDEILFYDITGAVGLDSATSNRGSATTAGRQARVRAESEAPAPPTTFSAYWTVASSFGITLPLLATKTPFGVPAIVMRCVAFLCRHGVKTVGIFRVPGNADFVADVKKRLDSGNDVDLGGIWSKSGRPATTEDVHVCASLLKTFVRDLPKPILTHAAYSTIMKESETQSDQFKLALSIKETLELLPKPSRALLQYLSYFMQYILQQETFNNMTAQNLAIVWVPNLFRDETDPDDPNKELRMLPHAMRAAVIMFTQAKVVFPLDSSSLLPPCFDPLSGNPLPVEDVCTHDVSQPVLASNPIPLEEREFDSVVASKKELAPSFSLRAVVTKESSTASVESNPSSTPHHNRVLTTPKGLSSRRSDLSEFGQDVEALSSMPEPEAVSVLSGYSILDLKRYLVKNGYDPTSCLEKKDLQRMAIECFRSRRGESIGTDDFSIMSGASKSILSAQPPSTLRRSWSFDRHRRRRSLESSDNESGSSKRGSDLALPRDRRDSEAFFLNSLKQAGLQVDDEVNHVSSIHEKDETSSISTNKTWGSTQQPAKRGFMQGPGQSTASSTSTKGGAGAGLMANFMRRKSLLSRNERDMAKSARTIKGPPASASGLLATTSPLSGSDSATDSPTVSGKGRRTGGNKSSDSEQPSLEDALQALKVTPLFGEDREALSFRRLERSGSNSSSNSLSHLETSNRTGTIDSATKWNVRDVASMSIRDLRAILIAHGIDPAEEPTVASLRERAKRLLIGRGV